jgi:hypothetical protein
MLAECCGVLIKREGVLAKKITRSKQRAGSLEGLSNRPAKGGSGKAKAFSHPS